jgi:hypothetical protein
MLPPPFPSPSSLSILFVTSFTGQTFSRRVRRLCGSFRHHTSTFTRLHSQPDLFSLQKRLARYSLIHQHPERFLPSFGSPNRGSFPSNTWAACRATACTFLFSCFLVFLFSATMQFRTPKLRQIPSCLGWHRISLFGDGMDGDFELLAIFPFRFTGQTATSQSWAPSTTILQRSARVPSLSRNLLLPSRS